MVLQGIDISSNNNYLNLGYYSGQVVINKLTGGLSYFWKDNRTQDCINKGLCTGVYHFAHENGVVTNADNQALFFYSHYKPFKYKVLPILDYEIAMNGKNFTFKDIQWITTFMQKFKALSGVNPVLYTSKDVILENYMTDYLKQNNMLWFAQYANNIPTGWQSNPWTDKNEVDLNVIGQQYSSHGRIQGISGDVDLSIFYISRENWFKACKPN